MIASENQKSQYDLRRSDSMSPITYIIIIERIGERGAESVGEGVVIEKRRPDDRCGRRHASGPRRATGVCTVVPSERSDEGKQAAERALFPFESIAYPEERSDEGPLRCAVSESEAASEQIPPPFSRLVASPSTVGTAEAKSAARAVLCGASSGFFRRL